MSVIQAPSRNNLVRLRACFVTQALADRKHPLLLGVAFSATQPPRSRCEPFCLLLGRGARGVERQEIGVVRPNPTRLVRVLDDFGRAVSKTRSTKSAESTVTRTAPLIDLVSVSPTLMVWLPV